MQDTFTCIEDIAVKYNIEFSEDEKKNSGVIVDIFNGKLPLQYTYIKEIVNIFGLYYYHCVKDIETAKKCFMSAIMRKSVKAVFNLANHYRSINEFEEAIKYLKPLANSGNYEANHRIGFVYNCYANTINDVEHRNFYYNEMAKYCEIAIKVNFIESANFLGHFYVFKKDSAKTKYYFTISANANNVIGIRNLANYYYYLEKNNDEMKRLLNKGIELNDGESAFQLGNFYKIVEQNYQEMEKCYIKGMELGDMKSTVYLGVYSQKEKKEKEMLKCYFICLKKGYSSVAITLANYFKDKNLSLSKKFLVYASKLKNPWGYIELGNHYHLIEKNVKKMHYYYTKAYNLPDYVCKLTNKHSNSNGIVMSNLGIYYENNKNYQAAERCYLKSFEEKNKQVSYLLGHLYQYNIHNHTLMKKYYDIAIKECKNSQALNDMLKYYSETEKNPRMMWHYYNNGIRLKFNVDNSIIIKYINSKLVSAEKKDDCMICYEEKDMYFSNCENHAMCKDCSIKLYLKPCPYCRKRPNEQ